MGPTLGHTEVKESLSLRGGTSVLGTSIIGVCWHHVMAVTIYSSSGTDTSPPTLRSEEGCNIATLDVSSTDDDTVIMCHRQQGR